MRTPGPWTRVPTSKALCLVRGVIARQDNPIKVQDLYKEALKEPCKPPGESIVLKLDGTTAHPINDHTVRSMRYASRALPYEATKRDHFRYMKRVLLPNLVQRKEVEQIHVKPTITAEDKAQKLKALSRAQRQTKAVKDATHGYFAWRLAQPPNPPKPKPEVEVFGAAVGVGEDWSHLNKRRQNARGKKVGRDVDWLKELRAVRSPAAKSSP